MKIKGLKIFFLIVIALTLTVIAIEGFRTSPSVVQASPTTRQQWEYKEIYRAFHWNDGAIDTLEWWTEDGKDLPIPQKGHIDGDMRARVQQLGLQGWELVSVTPMSSGVRTSLRQTNLGVSEGSSWGGVSTEDRWMFKRPKP